MSISVIRLAPGARRVGNDEHPCHGAFDGSRERYAGAAVGSVECTEPPPFEQRRRGANGNCGLC